jgi:hypothetical protein
LTLRFVACWQHAGANMPDQYLTESSEVYK